MVEEFIDKIKRVRLSGDFTIVDIDVVQVVWRVSFYFWFQK